MDRRRFERLERPRAEAPEEALPSEAAERVAGVAAEPQGMVRPSTGLTPERFETELALDTEEAAPTFHRCYRCGADSQRDALACEHCGADLTTREQAAFDRQLFERERSEHAHEEAAERQALLEPATGAGSPQDALAKAFAEEFTAEREARLPPGRRWLRLLPWPWRLVIIAALVALLLASLRMGRTSVGWFLAFWGECLLALVLFTPIAWWGRRASRPFLPPERW